MLTFNTPSKDSDAYKNFMKSLSGTPSLSSGSPPSNTVASLSTLANTLSPTDKVVKINDLLDDRKQRVLLQQDPNKQILKKSITPFQNTWTISPTTGSTAAWNFVECPKASSTGATDPNTHLISRP